MRPPIDVNRAYTVLSQTEARRTLSTKADVPRHATARMTLDQLHDALSERMVGANAADFLVITDKTFQRFAAMSDRLLLRYHGAPIDPGAGISSLTAARRAFEDAGVQVPEDAAIDDLEDALSGLHGSRQMILGDADFEAYGREMAQMLATVPSGRAAVREETRPESAA